MPTFEFDTNKSAVNKDKHGIDFVEAQKLWSDSRLLEFPANTTSEPRFIAIGVLSGKHWTAVFTPRGNNIRLISVRRSRKNEISAYDNI